MAHDQASDASDWQRFRTACARIGRDAGLVQGAGGNVSLKRQGVLHVKASGKWLADAEQQDIFVALDLDKARSRAAAGSEGFADCLLDGATLRPSIETGMHVVMPQTVVLHLHSVNALWYATLRHGQHALAQPLAGIDWHWIPYCRPGAPLADAIRTRIDLNATTATVLVLGNHGLVVAADDLHSTLTTLATVETALHRSPRPVAPPDQGAALAATARRIGALVPADPLVQCLALDRVASDVAALGALYPDHVVFLGATPTLRTPGQMEQFRWQDCATAYVIIRHLGVLVRPDISLNALAMLSCWAQLAMRIDSADDVAPLPQSSILELSGWEAEKYRQSLQVSTSP